ncbi:hypothetical protein BGZ65_002865 [Modicella reniformis]|uniref:Alkaline phosphatase n=1 Tax=Modicella reniformis TaxID=1440133 RepID=A0A9P6MI17_9FUNG|nr:hypothetical protein BGZ65_002865 [Modicella reniformis]
MAENESSRLLPYQDPRDTFGPDQIEELRREENKQIRRDRARLILWLILAIILTSSAIAFTYFFARVSLGKSRNVIMMVSDGFGPASETFARTYYQYINNMTEGYMTPLDEILIGSSRTRSSSSYVSDSAAGATAFACALKTYNNAVGVDQNGIPCGTMLTGIVVTTRATDATPGSFSSHVTSRFQEGEIAKQQIGDYVLGRQVDLLMGGGRCHFLPNTTDDGCRTDQRDLLQEGLSTYGWKNVMSNRQEFQALNATDTGIPLPAIGLFSKLDMSFEMDRDKEAQPSLSEMAAAALKSLQLNAGTNQGFFLLIEGSRIDVAAHSNDPAAHVNEILEYHRTVELVRAFVAENTDTLLISTSDHETGGFTVGFQPDPTVYPEYQWKPEVLTRAKSSTEVLANKLWGFPSDRIDVGRRDKFVRREILEQGLGITDPTQEEMHYLIFPKKTVVELSLYLGQMLSRRAWLGWTTPGHTGVDVNLYADGHADGFKSLHGNHENTDIGEALSAFLKVDLDLITWRLSKDTEKWFHPKAEVSSNLDNYHHQKTGN